MHSKFFILTYLIYKTVFCIDQKSFENEALISHNLYRLIHGVPNLSLNHNLSNIAVMRAYELAKSKYLSVKQLEFKGKKLGETIGSVSGFNVFNGISATQLWYSMVSKFDLEGENSLEAASFSQLIWKNTKEVGFGIAQNDGKFYFVAEYFPSGNIPGEYEKNVFQLNTKNDINVKYNNVGKKNNELATEIIDEEFLTGILEVNKTVAKNNKN